MMSIKDWVFSQMISKSIGSTRPLSASESRLSQDSQNEDHGSRVSAETCCSLNDTEMTQNSLPTSPVENPSEPHLATQEANLDPLSTVEALQIKFLRVIQRLGLSQDNVTVAKVLYRIHLASLIRAGESDLKKVNLKGVRARAVAAKQEAIGLPKLDFSLKILVLGRTGVGKSSTINSILAGSKATTDAFQPSTTQIQEITGSLNGLKLCFIDTPGLFPPSSFSDRRNRAILQSVKRFVQNSHPDVILYFERLDLINLSYPHFPLLKLITDVLGPSIWFSTDIVMTHSSAALPEGQNGYPVNYDSYVKLCSQVVQHQIHQTMGRKLENPVILVENHPGCDVDPFGNKVLPNGQVWISEFILLCLCTKILGDVNALLNFQDSLWLGKSRAPSLPHLLSSFLKHDVQLRLDGDDNRSFCDLPLSESDDEDEYDQLPPIRILTKAQFEKLSCAQKKNYLDELDYRETLFLKKKMMQEHFQTTTEENNNNNTVSGDEAPVGSLLPDMEVPPSFDSDNPAYRFRCLLSSGRLIARPVLDPHGWDHDVGFDGTNLEVSGKTKNLVSCITGQISKDKQDLNVQCESTMGLLGPGGETYTLGLDVQSPGRELLCTARTNAKVRNFGCGISLTSFGDQCYCGAKIGNTFLAGKRMDLRVGGGGMRGGGKGVFGGTLETTLRGRYYPMRDDRVTLAVTVIDFEKETVLGASVESSFRVGHGTRMSVSANVNNRKMGQLGVKVCSSEHMEVALVALVVTVLRSMFRTRRSRITSSTTIMDDVAAG